MTAIDAVQKNIDLLTAEEVQHLKWSIWSTQEGFEPEALEVPGDIVVAEGDSWFDYAPGLDILDHLRDMGLRIIKVADGGDTLDNMVYGTQYSRNFSRKEPPLQKTLRLIRDNRPKALLFSGGGNDIAGAELEAYLNHSTSGLGIFRQAYVDYVFDVAIPRAYEHLIQEVTKVKPDIVVISHGYGFAIPDGRAVVNLPFGYRFVGPWLRPAMTKKNYVDASQARGIMRTLVGRFNDTLKKVEGKHPGSFKYINLLDRIQDEHWVNELHLKNSAYRMVAEEFAKAI